jgi:hypothetical protein
MSGCLFTASAGDSSVLPGFVCSSDAPLVSYAGSGSGAACALCDEAVAQGELEFELDFAAATRAATLHMHFQCQRIWDAERAAVRSAKRSA